MKPALAQSAVLSLSSYLNPAVWSKEREIEIAGALRAGRLVMVQDALRPEFAAHVHRALDQAGGWELCESYDRTRTARADAFNFHHHNLFRDSSFEGSLAHAKAVFCSAPTAQWAAALAGVQCRAPTQFSASWYQPGDHSCPHNDFIGHRSDAVRSVAFVWYLTRDWRDEWGGALYWCPSQRYLPPRFNALALFRVSDASSHCVTTVSSFARSKRLAVNGWWQDLRQPVAGEPAGAMADAGPPAVEVI